MKQTAKFLGVAAVAISISLGGSTTRADNGHHGGGYSGGYHGGGYYGGNHGRYYGGHYGGFYGVWYPWNFLFPYVYTPSPHYYYDGYYYPPTVYYSPPVVYNSQPAEAYNAPTAVYNSGSAEVYNSPPPAPVAESPQQSVVDRPLSPTAVDRDSPPPPPRAQRPPQIQRSDQGQSMGAADVKAMAKAGVSDEVILSQIRNSRAVYHLSAAEIIDLKESGVSDKIIDFMINTASALQTEERPSSDTGLFATTPSDDFSSRVTVTTDPTVVVRDDIKKLAESVKRFSPGRQRMEIFYTLEDKRLVVSGAEFAYLMAVTDPFDRSTLLETGLQHSFILLPITEGDRRFLLEEIPANERGRVSDLLQSVQPTASTTER